MATGVVLRELGGISGQEWDGLVAGHPQATVFHLSAWHDCLERSLPGRVVRFAVESDGQRCGHWCAFLLTRLGFKVLGAPLPGSATDYMHPLFDVAPEVDSFLAAVGQWAAQKKVAMVEIGGEYLSDEVLEAHGYTPHATQTYRVDLTGGADQVWANLKSAMRNKIRKAEKAGVVVSEDPSPEFADLFYDMLLEVFGRQGLAPTYGRERVRTIVTGLRSSDNVATLVASHDADPLATVILLLDDRAAYFWGGASYQRAYPFGANDVIHWHALQLAIERGLAVYDTCGGGDYKVKFGGDHLVLPAGHVCLSPMFGLVRSSVSRGVRLRGTVLGRLYRLRARSA